MKEQYALPVYQPDNIENIDELEILLTVSDSAFLGVLLLTIRGNTIKFLSNLVNKKQINIKKSN